MTPYADRSEVLAACMELLALDRRPAVAEVRAVVRDYYECEGCAAGGSLHIVLDDGNVSDEDVAWCREWAEERGDAAGEALARVLLRLTVAERDLL